MCQPSHRIFVGSRPRAANLYMWSPALFFFPHTFTTIPTSLHFTEFYQLSFPLVSMPPRSVLLNLGLPNVFTAGKQRTDEVVSEVKLQVPAEQEKGSAKVEDGKLASRDKSHSKHDSMQSSSGGMCSHSRLPFSSSIPLPSLALELTTCRPLRFRSKLHWPYAIHHSCYRRHHLAPHLVRFCCRFHQLHQPFDDVQHCSPQQNFQPGCVHCRFSAFLLGSR